jgi:transcription elongation factor GreB
LEEEAVVPRPVSLLPSGVRNRMTARGARRLRAELLQLVERERASIASRPQDDPETKRLHQTLQRRIGYLQESLRTAEVQPRPVDEHRVSFGATVTVRDSQQNLSTYSLVGVDETDPDRNWVSWLSPIAKTLWQARLGQRVSFEYPSGRTELEVVQIVYDQPD